MVSGPSGVGKGTVVAGLRRRRPDLVVSVSATTRAPRDGEVDGRHYHFLTRDEFDVKVAEGAFLEWAEFGGNRYGTPWSSVERALSEGRTVLLEIEVQGARQVRERFSDAVLIFLAPPTWSALEKRLRGRGTDTEERITQRLRTAEWELSLAEEFDHVVVNDVLEDTIAQIDRILGDAHS